MILHSSLFIIHDNRVYLAILYITNVFAGILPESVGAVTVAVLVFGTYFSGASRVFSPVRLSAEKLVIVA